MVTTSPNTAASTAAWYPQPVPTSSTRARRRAEGARQAATVSIIRATVLGLEIVCPCPIGSATSSYARLASPGSTNWWRGTRCIAASTSASRMPLERKASTMRPRARSDAIPMPAGDGGSTAWRRAPGTIDGAPRRFTASATEPVADLRHRRPRAQIDVERGHRDLSLGERVEVGAGACVLR